MEGSNRNCIRSSGNAEKGSSEMGRAPAQPKESGARPAPVENKNRVLQKLIAHLKSDG